MEAWVYQNCVSFDNWKKKIISWRNWWLTWAWISKCFNMYWKKALKPGLLRGLAKSLINDYGISIRRACAVILLHRSLWYYASKARDSSVIRKRMHEIAQVRIRYGYWRIFTLLRREGWRDNHKRVYHIYIYKEEGLNLRSKRPKRSRMAAQRLDRPQLFNINQCWSMDFVADQLFDGRKFRLLTVVDDFSRKCLAIQVGQSI